MLRWLQALEAASVAALPEVVRIELEQIEDAGGVGFLQEMSTQIKVRKIRCGSEPQADVLRPPNLLRQQQQA